MKFAKRVRLLTSTILSISSSLVNSQWKGNTRITNNSQWPNSSIKTIYSKHQPKQKFHPLIITNQNKTKISNSKRKHSQFVYPHNSAKKIWISNQVRERESWETVSERRERDKESEREGRWEGAVGCDFSILHGSSLWQMGPTLIHFITRMPLTSYLLKMKMPKSFFHFL